MAKHEQGSPPPVTGVLAGILVLAAVVAAGIWLSGGGDRGTTPASAQSPGPTPIGQDPCAYQEIDPEKYGHQELVNPPEVSARGRVLKTKLRVAYTKKSKTEIAGCPVHLRTYNGKLVGPTLRLKPGQTLDLKLRNDLPRETKKQIAAQFEQESGAAYISTTPHSFNTTNLHTHGLHVSPRGNGDNVLLAVEPQTTQPYDIEIPRDHPPGSFWYHAHGHGSTAIQVGSGMAGTIVIEDGNDIPPALAAANEREKIMLFGSILYDTQGEVDDIAAFFPNSPPNACDQGLSTCTWQDSHRRTTINGQIVPRIHMQPGEVQRWRMIDGTFRETLEIQLDGHSLHEIALDGLYLGQVDTWAPDQPIELQPGYRSDVLVQASSEPGTYLLRDGPTPAGEALRGVTEDEEILAEIVVEGEPVDMELPTDDEMAALEPFPGVDLAKEATGVQVANFKLGQDAVASPKNYFQINFQAFDPAHTRRLALGAVDEWLLSTSGDPKGVPGSEAPPSPPPGPIPPLEHIFHIHINPFQMERAGPDGETELVWKDTLLVPTTASLEEPLSVYTKYTDFTGKFVIHCHILDHEDLGMMEAVKVVRPGAVIDKPEPEHH